MSTCLEWHNTFALSSMIVKLYIDCVAALDRPTGRWGHSLCFVNKKMSVLVGGQGEKSQLCKDSVWTLDCGRKLFVTFVIMHFPFLFRNHVPNSYSYIKATCPNSKYLERRFTSCLPVYMHSIQQFNNLIWESKIIANFKCHYTKIKFQHWNYFLFLSFKALSFSFN